MSRSTRVYHDLDFNFIAHPVTGDVSTKTNEDAVKASIKHLVMTATFERPFRSKLGSNVRNILFENVSPLTKNIIQQEIYNTITNFEPRVDVLGVNVGFSPDNHQIYVSVIFKIKLTETSITVDFILERTR